MNASKAASFASLPAGQRTKVLDGFNDTELAALEYDWPFWARPDQLAPPGDWETWLALAGRGWGKTRCGAEWVRDIKNTCGRIALVGPTAADVRDVMVGGESGLLAVSPPWDRPTYEPSKRLVTWPNGATATCFSAEEPERLRGPQHSAAWADEAAAWRYANETWDQLQFGLRLGRHPQVVVTTTPKPIKLLRELLADPATAVTRGTTQANMANLAPSFVRKVVRKYEGTRLGRQELNAELLEDTPGSLWKRADIDAARVPAAPADMRRVVVAIDPATTAGEDSDETGIVVAGIGHDGFGYVLEDLTCRETPQGWARIAVDAYQRHKADRIVAETNQGGDMVEHTIRTVLALASYSRVHAKRGKVLRAEPVSALYEQHRVRHVGSLPVLEDQLCGFTADFDAKSAGYSPDRVDALVYALSELMLGAEVRPARAVRINHMAR